MMTIFPYKNQSNRLRSNQKGAEAVEEQMKVNS